MTAILPPNGAKDIDDAIRELGPDAVRAHVEAQRGRRRIRWADLQGKRPPQREWAVYGWLPMGHPTLMAGAPGKGKTLLTQCMASHLALGISYVDEIAVPRRCLLWLGEDDRDEIWRRQYDIAGSLDRRLDEFEENLIIEPFDDRDMTLATNVRGTLTGTPLMEELRDQIHDYGADCVFLDSSARVFGGNENDRHEVTQFLTWLKGAAGAAATCLVAHPAKSSTSEFSGSTAWEGSVRSRLLLSHKPPGDEQQDDDEPIDENIRYLARRKANYAANDLRRLRYVNGALIPEEAGIRRNVGPEVAAEVVVRAIRKLKEIGKHGNGGTRSQDYLPKLAKQYRLLDDIDQRSFAAAMREMEMSGRIKSVEVGKYSNRSPKMGFDIPDCTDV